MQSGDLWVFNTGLCWHQLQRVVANGRLLLSSWYSEHVSCKVHSLLGVFEKQELTDWLIFLSNSCDFYYHDYRAVTGGSNTLKEFFCLLVTMDSEQSFSKSLLSFYSPMAIRKEKMVRPCGGFYSLGVSGSTSIHISLFRQNHRHKPTAAEKVGTVNS